MQDIDIENDPEIIFLKKHNAFMPKNDHRGYPDGAASPPFDIDGCHWKEGYPETPGYYAVALNAYDYPHMCITSLPVEKLYYEGERQWSRRRCSRTSLMHEKYFLDEGDSCGWCWTYYPEYWCEIPESGKLPPCIFDY